MKETSSTYQSLQLHLNTDDEDNDYDCYGDEHKDESMVDRTNGGDCILTPEEAQRFERMLDQKQQKQQQQQPLPWQQQQQPLPWQQQQRGKLLTAVGLVLMVGALLLNSRCMSHDERAANNNKNPLVAPPPPPQTSSTDWIPWTLPSDLNLQSADGALAMNTDGSVIAIGDPMGIEYKNPCRGRVILLQAAAQEEGEGLVYRTVQTIEGDDDYSEFGTALALSSSSTNTLVVGIPRNVEKSRPCCGTVQVYYYRQQQTPEGAAAADNYWEMVDEFPNQSQHDQSGAWVAVSDDGSRVLYSAPYYQLDPGDRGYKDKSTTSLEGPQDDQFYNPTTGAVLLWHNEYQEAFLRGNCTYESFGQTVAVSSSGGDDDDMDNSRAVAVITRAGCYNNEDKQRTITAYEGDDTITDLLVPDPPSKDCYMGQTGTAATVSKDGKRIVVLAACLDQETYQTRLAIHTFEKDQKSQTWVQIVSPTTPTVIVDADLCPYGMSKHAFDDDAKTVVLTGAGGGEDLVCYKWNDKTLSWQESWRKAGADSGFGVATKVALSGNGQRLAILSYTIHGDSYISNLSVYSLA